jgi:O-antigen/teichoic acid export membrane protein
MRTRLSLGLLDQAVVALANAANPLLAVALLSKSAAASMLLALAFAYFAVGLGRAFIGEVLLAYAPRLDPEHRRSTVRDAVATALVVGVGAAAVLICLHLIGVPPNLPDLAWAAMAVPAVLLQDTARLATLAERAPGRALAVDSTWVGVQALVISALITTDRASAATLFGAWALGAAIAGLSWLLLRRINPLRGRPARWVRQTRHVGGWFTATAVVGQTHVLVVAFSLAGVLTREAYALLRLAQVGVLQPLQNVIVAVNAMLVPRASHLAGEHDLTTLRRQTLRGAAALGAFGALVVAVASLAAEPVLRLLKPEYLGAAALALPTALQAAIYLVQVPFTSALRGMHRGRYLLYQYLVFSVTSLAAMLAGALAGGLTAAVWGLTVGSAAGLATMIALYRRAARTLDTANPQ